MNSNGHQSMDEEAAVSIAAMSKGLMDSRGSSDNNNIENRTTGEREASRLIRAQQANNNNEHQPQNNVMNRGISFEKENQHNSDHTTAVVDQQSNNNVSKSPTSRGLIRNGTAAFASVDIPQPEERNSSSEMVHEDDNGSRLQGVRLSYFDEENSSNIMAGVTRVDNPDVSNNNNNQYNSQYNDEEENEYDDCSSDASGQTVVHNDCPVPPVNATQEEINKFYWEWCYGKINNDDSDDSSVAAVKGNNNVLKNGGLGIRTAPAKSWYVCVQCVYLVLIGYVIQSNILLLIFFTTHLVYQPRRKIVMWVPTDHRLNLFHHVDYYIIHLPMKTIMILVLHLQISNR